jgi:16S rRNA (uracil1498-N3)-methyltransferase
MRRIRAHVTQSLAVGSELTLEDTAADHLVRVLRLRTGDEVVLFNGDGADYAAVLCEAGRRRVTARVLRSEEVATESPLRVTLAQALARGDKMDLVVQKATELGATAIVPLLTERSEVRLDAGRAGKRVEHWRAVAASACEQCGRARLPEIAPLQGIETWSRSLPGDGPMRVALLPEATMRVRDLPSPTAGIVLMAGPEGGLGKRDIAVLTAAGFAGLNLGPRILRTETAGLAALAALQALHGDV